ncbi:hypothetical protein EDD18DRAFT_1157543 [Armillaria luteobubalina]|uniref:DUF6534 domain-containing protein n=1 Tax=Armillaria luteobubalina TaxID=153913 RepID=A0AA39Q8T5_9AGAR|nr:hypothetical protein EDD18DRAFT_1157543 [Armillaria luteobubalina]
MPVLDGTLGATLIGVVIASMVYGLSLLQLYSYITGRCSDKDGLFLKAFIAVLMSVNTLHLVLVCHSLYYYTITHFADFEVLAVSTWSAAVHIPVGAVVSSLVQFFYAYRLYLLNGRKYAVPTIIVSRVFSVLQTAMGISLAVKISTIRYFTKAKLIQPYSVSTLACECLCNIIITLAMAHCIRKSETGPLSSKKLQERVYYVISTGALTMAMAVAAVISWLIAPNTLVDAALYIIMVRLYPCSFLAILNARDDLLDFGDMTMEGPESHMSFLSHATTTHQE